MFVTYPDGYTVAIESEADVFDLFLSFKTPRRNGQGALTPAGAT